MYRVDLAADQIQREALLRRQKLDEERKKRIFDPKVRCLGIDVDALNEQIQIKNQIKEIEKTREQAFGNEAADIAKTLSELDERVSQDRRKQLAEINEYRLTTQQAQARREYDLNDPLGKRNGLPARLSDDDPRCGPSSLQKFFGEDLGAKERAALQKEQMAYWAQQQLAEKEAKRQEEEELKRLESLQISEITRRRKELEDAERELRAAILQETKEYNLKLAEIKHGRDAQAKNEEVNNNIAEITAQVNSDFLTENPEQARSALGPYRVRCDVFKGISPEEKKRILDEQERQRRELQARKEQERLEQQEWDLQQAAQLRAALRLEREKARLQKKAALDMQAQNAESARKFKDNLEYLNKVVYTNDPTEGYFGQFNTTSR